MTVGKWLACIYRSMDEFHVDDQLYSKLQALPMIPLTNGQFVALDALKVFFPLDKEEHRKRSTKKFGESICYLVHVKCCCVVQKTATMYDN